MHYILTLSKGDNMGKRSRRQKRLSENIDHVLNEREKEEKKNIPVTKGYKEEKPHRDTSNTTTLFCYGTLNIHEVQRVVWGEAMEGVTGILPDYELKLWAGSSIMYVDKKIGEQVVGKAYELTKEQLEATDKFETDMYKRERIFPTGKSPFEVYVRNPEANPAQKVVLK